MPMTTSWNDRDCELNTVWQGEPMTLGFLYEQHVDGYRKERPFMVDVETIKFQPDSGKYFLYGYCQSTDSQECFDSDNITTEVLFEGKRFNVQNWLQLFVEPVIDDTDLFGTSAG